MWRSEQRAGARNWISVRRQTEEGPCGVPDENEVRHSNYDAQRIAVHFRVPREVDKMNSTGALNPGEHRSATLTYSTRPHRAYASTFAEKPLPVFKTRRVTYTNAYAALH